MESISRACFGDMLSWLDNKDLGFESHLIEVPNDFQGPWLRCQCDELEHSYEVLARIRWWQRRIQDLGLENAWRRWRRKQKRTRINHQDQMAHSSHYLNLVRAKGRVCPCSGLSWQQAHSLGFLRWSRWARTSCTKGESGHKRAWYSTTADVPPPRAKQHERA